MDTSVWIDHLRVAEAKLRELLGAGDVLMHSMVIGEIACGNLARREQVLARLRSLPRIPELEHEDVIRKIESERFMGRGLGFIDAHLICSVLSLDDTSLWTRDLGLKRVSEELGVAFSETLRNSTNGEELPSEDLGSHLAEDEDDSND